MNVLQRRWEEWNVTLRCHTLGEFLLMLSLGRRSLPW